jgi:hypothetical protein
LPLHLGLSVGIDRRSDGLPRLRYDPLDVRSETLVLAFLIFEPVPKSANPARSSRRLGRRNLILAGLPRRLIFGCVFRLIGLYAQEIVENAVVFDIATSRINRLAFFRQMLFSRELRSPSGSPITSAIR